MLVVFVSVKFAEAKVYEVDLVFVGLVAADQEVVRLDVSVYYVVLVDDSDVREQLDCDLAHCEQVKLLFAELVQFFERRSKQVHYHDVNA